MSYIMKETQGLRSRFLKAKRLESCLALDTFRSGLARRLVPDTLCLGGKRAASSFLETQSFKGKKNLKDGTLY